MSHEYHRHKVSSLQDEGCLLVEDGNHGEYRPRPSEFAATGTAFIRAADMADGRVCFETAEHINDVALKRIRKGIGQAGDILFSHKGTVGKLALVPPDAPPFVCSPQTTFWRTLNEKRLDRRYLYYYMSSRVFIGQWDSRKGETDMADYVSLTAQRDFVLDLPAIETQRDIAHILGTLDDKIGLNRKMNRTLEAMAQALFRSWLEGHEEEATTTRVQELIDRRVLLIGDGYRAKRAELGEGGLPFARAGNLTDGFDFTDAEILGPAGVRAAREKVARDFDAVFTSKGTVGRLAQVLPSTPRFVYAPQLCYWRTLNPETLNPHILFQWMRDTEFKSQVDAVKGQTDMADYVSLTDQRAMEITLPFSADQSEVGKRLEAFALRIDSNTAESRTLGALRDSLLPGLLSGDIRVDSIETVIEAAP